MTSKHNIRSPRALTLGAFARAALAASGVVLAGWDSWIILDPFGVLFAILGIAACATSLAGMRFLNGRRGALLFAIFWFLLGTLAVSVAWIAARLSYTLYPWPESGRLLSEAGEHRALLIRALLPFSGTLASLALSMIAGTRAGSVLLASALAVFSVFALSLPAMTEAPELLWSQIPYTLLPCLAASFLIPLMFWRRNEYNARSIDVSLLGDISD